MPLTGIASRHPSSPPTSASTGGFEHERDQESPRREKPSARSVPISLRPRRDDRDTSCSSRPITAPIAMISDTNHARPVDQRVPIGPAWLS